MNGQGEYRKIRENVIARQNLFIGIPEQAEPDWEANRRDYCNLPDALSAKKTVTPVQAAILAITVLAAVIGLVYQREITVLIGAICFSLFYFLVVLFRAMVLADFDEENAALPCAPILDDTDKTYVILIALYQEAGQVKKLVKSVEKLQWKAGFKKVRLICEANDEETISAIRSIDLPAGFELLIVPDGKPRTKPRALNYGMAHVSGDYLVIYDAEDRPYPTQLLEAFSKFQNGPDRLVCVQAPLVIDNMRESFLTRLFAIEYNTLFQGILPTLTKWNAPMPLGGTSNHFKFAELRKAGGWDSYNVTEDADLGIRLARCGKLCGVIKSPTYEEAPAQLKPWITQRTRWIKGWIQTLLTHMRNPIKTAKDMGLGAFFKFQLVLTSVVTSVLVHPVFLVAFIFQMMNYFSGQTLTNYDIGITAVSAFNLIAGYSTYGFLAYAVHKAGSRNQSAFWILALPVYWVLISIAGWRALFQIMVQPHYWEKTPHVSINRNEDTRIQG